MKAGNKAVEYLLNQGFEGRGPWAFICQTAL